MQYELFYLVGASREAELEKIKTDIDGIVEKASGKFEEKMTEEKRRMAYEIGKETHGIYIARRFELEEKENIGEIIKKINLYPDVLRFILSRADELPELKSKEERMAEATARDQKVKLRKEEKREPVSKLKVPEMKKEIPEEKKTEEKEVSSKTPAEDIDKKLEEILNI